MGRASRWKPERLAEKLLQIRLALGLSQNEMLRRLGLPAEFLQASISGYELGTRVPPLPAILRYAQAAGICTDVLLDDELELPDKLPSKSKHSHH